MNRTEDQVRDTAKDILGFIDSHDADSGTGQITTFNQLGFKGIIDKPDGWYLPKNTGAVAIILETKAENVDLDSPKWVDELNKNVDIALTRYKNVIGLLYNGRTVRCFRNKTEIQAPPELQDKQFYIDLFLDKGIDKQRIYELTARINNLLRTDFGIIDLYDRMVFTACALVAERYGGRLSQMKGRDYETFHTSIHSTLSKSMEDDRKQNGKLNILLERYSGIRMNITDNQNAIDDFIDWVVEISGCINSNQWRGEDVMGIFFNEFNRYREKSEAGQVFTPEHITDFMYRILEVGKDDHVLDAACGSGGFLVKAMANMMQEAGGVNTAKAREIKRSQLFGIELYENVYALACANMLIHKDGKTNLECLDSRSDEAAAWIESKKITKVLMNPPFERKYGCIKIVENVLNSVPVHTMCGFILPDKKLEKEKGATNRIRKRHRLRKIIKMPEDLFPNTGVTTSIFVFEAGVPQNDQEIFACYMESDGLETVKNKGRHDVHSQWAAIENHWVDVVMKQSGEDSCQWVDPSKHMSYQMPVKPFEIGEEDFRKTAMDYIMFKSGMDSKTFKDGLLDAILYSSVVESDADHVSIILEKNKYMKPVMDETMLHLRDANGAGRLPDGASWNAFAIKDLFVIKKGTRLTRADMLPGDTPFIGATLENNGITATVGNTGHVHPGGVMTVAYNGQKATGKAFWQPEPFWASDDVNVLYPKFELTKEIALFLQPLFWEAGRPYSFGDKWGKEIMEQTTLKLPVSENDEPDWPWMGDYMKTMLRKAESSISQLQNVTPITQLEY